LKRYLAQLKFKFEGRRQMTDPAPRPNQQADASSPADLMREQRLQRNLKILVGGMSLLILLGIGAVAVRMVSLATGSRATRSSAQTAIAAPSGQIALELPKGAKVVSISISGNRLAVHHEGPSGTGIAVIDLDSGRRIADVKALEAVPQN
jgi:hypothetical protein